MYSNQEKKISITVCSGATMIFNTNDHRRESEAVQRSIQQLVSENQYLTRQIEFQRTSNEAVNTQSEVLRTIRYLLDLVGKPVEASTEVDILERIGLQLERVGLFPADREKQLPAVIDASS